MYANITFSVKRYSNKFLKLLMCFALAFTFLYAQPKAKYEQASANPIVFLVGAAWEFVVKPILISLAIEIAVNMGIKFVDKTQAKKHAGEIVEKAKKYLKDTDFGKVYDKNSKKIKFTVGAGVIALLTTLWGKKVGDTQQENKVFEDKLDYSVIDGVTVIKRDDLNTIDSTITTNNPLYNTGVKLSYAPYGGIFVNNQAGDFASRMFNITFTPIPYMQRSNVQISSKLDNRLLGTFYIKGGTSNYLLGATIKVSNDGPDGYSFRIFNDADFDLTTQETPTNLYDNQNSTVFLTEQTVNSNYTIRISDATREARLFHAYLRELAVNNRTIILADGMVIADNQKYIQLENDYENLDTNSLVTALSGVGITTQQKEIELTLPDNTDMSGWVEGNWEDITGIVPTVIENITPNPSTDLVPVTNPVYVVDDKKQTDFTQIIIIGGGGGSGGGSGGGLISPLDGSLLAYIRNSYEYATNIINTGVQGLQSVGVGAVAFLTFASSFMSAMMPDEFMLLFVSTFALACGLWVIKR